MWLAVSCELHRAVSQQLMPHYVSECVVFFHDVDDRQIYLLVVYRDLLGLHVILEHFRNLITIFAAVN